MKPHVSEAEVRTAQRYLKESLPPDGYRDMTPEQKEICERQFIRGMLVAVKLASREQ